MVISPWVVNQKTLSVTVSTAFLRLSSQAALGTIAALDSATAFTVSAWISLAEDSWPCDARNATARAWPVVSMSDGLNPVYELGIRRRMPAAADWDAAWIQAWMEAICEPEQPDRELVLAWLEASCAPDTPLPELGADKGIEPAHCAHRCQ